MALRLSEGLGRTRGVEIFIGLRAWIDFVRGKLGVLVVPGRFASDKYVAAWVQVWIGVQCSKCDDSSFQSVESLDE